MKKNPLSVWTFSYRPIYYLTHPWKWFNDLYWNFRNWIHRANWGYAYMDVWEFADWYPRVAAEALRYMAKHGHGYPGIKPWQTPELWKKHLEYLANQLQRCADSQDICWGEERNEYHEAYKESLERAYYEEEGEDGLVHSHYNFTEEDKEIRKNYWRREEEIHKADKQYREEVFKFLGANLMRYWD